MKGSDHRRGHFEIIEITSKIGKCDICGKEFYAGEEARMEKHSQVGTEPYFKKGEVLPFKVDMLKGPHRIGTAYDGEVRICKVIPARDYCQHQYTIEILDKSQERKLIVWWGAIEVCDDEFEKLIEKETGMPFGEFVDKWEQGEIEKLPLKVMEEILTLPEWGLLLWFKH